MSNEIGLTAAERAAVRALQRLARKWPRSLWLFSACGSLHVMKTDASGKRVMRKDEHHFAKEINAEITDQRASVATIDIPNDGGDF